MKRILITGANGYIANSLNNTLSANYDITCISRTNFDLTDSAALNNFFYTNKPFDTVIHCAVKGGNRLVKDDYSIMDINLTMYYNLLQHQGLHYNKLIHFGSGAEVLWYDKPYGLSKNIIAKSSKDRPHCYNIRIYGLFDDKELDRRFIKSNIKRYLNKQPMIIHQDKEMDFFYMKDLITLVEFYLNNDNLVKEIECRYNNTYLLSEIASIINECGDYRSEIFIEDKIKAEPYKGREGVPQEYNLSLLGLEKGIKETYNKIYEEYKLLY